MDNYASYGSISGSYPKSIEFSEFSNGDPLLSNTTYKRVLI
jgi:hypothetical protein